MTSPSAIKGFTGIGRVTRVKQSLAPARINSMSSTLSTFSPQGHNPTGTMFACRPLYKSAPKEG